jgi:hypothetical protein
MIDHRPMMAGRFGQPPTQRACVECPLRRSSKPGALGGYTVQQYLETLHGPADLACHLSPGFALKDRKAQRSCTGVAQFRRHAELSPEGNNAREAMAYVRDDPEAVFCTDAEFAAHHTPR